ncbi:sushi domain-containing protein 5 isoform X2 [Corythoichthys intestinalis]|uniref:sushi domain-containing protein 5 isoform X2 n=1 Tax=Corythoichthys intestinalis TaxID=161448 RepID=UPI0025A4FAF4|nr:sushi domain-containing protein 5 isoform X2 [Corythoichthys intestinalis]
MLGFLGCFAGLLVASLVNADGRVFVVELGNSSSSSSFRDAEWACASRQARLASASELRHAVMECFFSLCTRGWLHGGSIGTTVCNYVGGSLKAVDVRLENATSDAKSLNGFCIKDKDSTETHMDYEDQFTYDEADHQREDDGPAEGHAQLYEKPQGTTAQPEEPRNREMQVISFQREEEAPDMDGQQEVELDDETVEETRKDDVKMDVEDAGWKMEEREVTTVSTDPPVSLLSQKHLFWFPSDTFQQQQEQQPVSVDSVTQTTTQRSSGSQSEENLNNHAQESLDHRDDGQIEQQIPVHQEDLDEQDRYDDNHHDHYDMGEHEDVRYGGWNNSSEERGGDKDGDDILEQTDVSEEHTDHDEHADDDDQILEEHDDRDDDDHHDHDERYDHEHHDNDHDHDDHDERYDHEHHDNDDHNHDDLDHYDHLDHDGNDHDSQEHNPDTDDGGHDANDSHADHDSLEDDDHHQHVVFPEESLNSTQDDTRVATTTDETWLDGHPVAAIPNGVEELVPDTSVPAVPESEQREATVPENPSSSSSSDTLEYDTQQVVPTHSWLLDLTQHPILDPAQDSETLDGATGGHTLNLPGETGERGDMEGERGETVCVGENCPPSSPSRRGPIVAAIIAAVCVVAAAVMVTVWCYRRRQQKSSVYDMNGKGQSSQQMEMQQKV